jgi:hypothetical protein
VKPQFIAAIVLALIAIPLWRHFQDRGRLERRSWA